MKKTPDQLILLIGELSLHPGQLLRVKLNQLNNHFPRSKLNESPLFLFNNI